MVFSSATSSFMTTTNPLICILPKKLGLGGPSSFQSNLRKGLNERGVKVCFDPNEQGISAILVIGGTRHIAELRQAKKRGIPVIQRLNGMNWVHRQKWTGIRHFLKAERGNLLLASIRRMADQVIYQSEFARDWWARKQGSLSIPQSVIYNGVDLVEFCPPATTTLTEEYKLLMVEGHHGGGYDQGLFSGVALMEKLNEVLERPITLTVAGDVPEALRFSVGSAIGKIHWLGVVEHGRIPNLDRSAHLLFSSDVNAACPNSVIEAMACGLPVIGFDTGSLPELVRGDAGRIAPYGADVWRLEKPNISNLVNAAREVLLNQQHFSKAASELAKEVYSLERMTDLYIQVLLGK
jgi:glycosyltransferase involved in cell wall biosynthesis